MWIRAEDGCIGVHRWDVREAEISPPFAEDCLPKGLDAMVVQRCGWNKKMPCHGPNVGTIDRQHGPRWTWLIRRFRRHTAHMGVTGQASA